MKSCSLCGSKLTYKTVPTGDFYDPNTRERHASHGSNPHCPSADSHNHDAEWIKVD